VESTNLLNQTFSRQVLTSFFHFIPMPLVLVTGGTGFLGAYCIIKLLKSGYSVRTTIRTPSRESEVRLMLQGGGITSFENLSFCIADLTTDDGWPAAITSCDYVLHVASPISIPNSTNDDDLIIPAREGTLRILRYSRDLGVKRIVITSSFGTIGYGPVPDRPFNEDDWTDPNGPIQPYFKSKILAEQAAWTFFQNERGNLEMVVLNPVGIFGPALWTGIGPNLNMLMGLLNGTIPGTSTIKFAIVDVRDVAEIEVQALTNGNVNGRRFILTGSQCLSLAEIALILKENLREKAEKIEIRETPPDGDSEIIRNASNQRAVQIFGWNPIPTITTLVETAESLFRVGKLP
jgi:dihydroflavonol-4-reductase